jgi:hypothetical protein
MTMNIFEYVARNKVRFQSSKGLLSFEDLWEVPLRSKSVGDGFNLDVLAKAAKKAMAEASEESYVDKIKTAEQTKHEVVFEIVKYVIDTKLAEEVIAKTRAENRLKREKLLTALAEKQDGKMSAMSEKELRRQIDALDEDGT